MTQINTTEKEEIFVATTLVPLTNEAIVHAEPVEDSSLRYILVPLAALFSVLLLSALVLLMARNRRRLLVIYRNRQHGSHFKYSDEAQSRTRSSLVPDDNYFDDDPTECLLKGKLHINTNYNNNNKTHGRYDMTPSHSSGEFCT